VFATVQGQAGELIQPGVAAVAAEEFWVPAAFDYFPPIEYDYLGRFPGGKQVV
jgi:hypothetical protein